MILSSRNNFGYTFEKIEFPEIERKSYTNLEKSYDKNIVDMIEIIEENKFVGFFIVNFLKNNPYIMLDYFAILPNYQSRGYGSKAIKLLKEMYQDYDGIYIEIEKVGMEIVRKKIKLEREEQNFMKI